MVGGGMLFHNEILGSNIEMVLSNLNKLQKVD